MDKIMISKGETDGVVLAVGYVRSAGSGVEAAAAVEAQKAKIREFADARGVKIVTWHVDVGRSGNDLHRPGLEALLAAAEAPDPGFEMVLVSALNRMSRCLADLITIESALSASGIRLASATEGELQLLDKLTSAMLDGVEGVCWDNHSHQTRRDLRQSAGQGYWVSAPTPYGYRKVEVNDGGQQRTELQINPETADVVRATYDRAGQGASVRIISTELNENGVPSPSGGPWNAAQVRRILTNPVYAGVMVVGKNSDEPVEVRVENLKIVSRAVFEKVKELIKRGASKLSGS